MEEDKPFYKISEFAKRLNVHANTIRRAIKNGRISAFKTSDTRKPVYRIPHSEIERIMLFDLKDLIKKMIKEEDI